MPLYFKLNHNKSIKFSKYLLIPLLVTITVGLVAGRAGAQERKNSLNELVLSERLMTLIASRDGQGGSQLLAVTRNEPKDESQLRYLQQVRVGPDGSLHTAERQPLAPQIAAYAVCPNRAGADMLLGLGSNGISELLTGSAIIKQPTIFAHRSKDLFPSVSICFDLFSDQRPALVVPVLHGVSVFRWAEKSKTYEKHADIDIRAESRFFWQVAGQSPEGVGRQNASVSIDFPDNFITDFNGDGRPDMCLAYGEMVQCVMQNKTGGFVDAQKSRFNFDILSAAEKDDTSVRIRNRLLDIDGDNLADLIVQKTIWNLTGMETSLYIYKNKSGTGFKGAPDQVIRRSGYFAYHDFVDVSGDGLPDLVAPVADMNFADLARIVVSRSVSIDNVVYLNNKGSFAAEAVSVFSHSFPVNFRNATSLYSALPILNVRVDDQSQDKDKKGTVTAVFFPDKEKVAAVALPKAGEKLSRNLWTKDAEIGDIMVVTDLDGNGVDEIFTGSPRVTAKAKKIHRIELTPK